MKIRPITQVELDNLGLDENLNLYWNDKPIVTKKRVTLSTWGNFFGILASISLMGDFIINLYKLFHG